tara:strand:- start:955 stop:1407 length:453 start_codon:yes stop_codon:yes gene_type:complete
MAETSAPTDTKNFGSIALNEMIGKLKRTSDPRRRYEYVLWLAKKLPSLEEELRNERVKVKGCISQVFVLGRLIEGRLQWKGYSDALITKGLLSFLVQGLNNLTPEQIMAISPEFIKETGLHGSLTPSRANGFLNIFMAMQAQAKSHSKNV